MYRTSTTICCLGGWHCTIPREVDAVYGSGLAKGLWLTFRTMSNPPVTVQFPEEIRSVPARARTSLLWFDERCTGCSTCAQACPDGCILVATEHREDGRLHKVSYAVALRIC